MGMHESRAKLLNQMRVEKAGKEYKKNFAFYHIIRNYRNPKKEQLNSSNLIKKVKEIDPENTINHKYITNIKDNFNILTKDDILFGHFLALVGIEGDKKIGELRRDKKKAVTEKEKRYEKKRREQEYMDEKMKTEIMLKKLEDPNISDNDLMLTLNATKHQLAELNKKTEDLPTPDGGEKIDGPAIIPLTEGITDLYNINGKIMSKGKELIFNNLETLKIRQYQDLKILNDIIDTSFKQNRLIEGKSTENIAVGIADIYDAIIEKAEHIKEKSIIIEQKKD
ncbi:hypothetical protein EOM39_04515 [Candidatus Gracilibacteria bacterium]|nr:hypothetical protein [Candidatus Gracilibacteria bacterium]